VQECTEAKEELLQSKTEQPPYEKKSLLMEGDKYVKCHAGNVINKILISVHYSFRKMTALRYFRGMFPLMCTMCINISARQKSVS
jgi:hypothetical protein